MSTRNDRFNRSMRSLEEFIDSFEDPSKIAAFSDRGTGVPPVQNRKGQIPLTNGQDARSPEDARSPGDDHSPEAKLHAAIMRLRRAKRGYLIPVLRLIVKYGAARYLSLEKISRAQYFRHRNELLRFFS